MEQIPKFVQGRLASPAPSGHPDADLLNAFSEDALGQQERAQILEHLAVCDNCREVIALSAPQEDLRMAAAVGAAIPMAARAETSPRRGFNLRWGTAAALAVIIIGAVAISFRATKKMALTTPASIPLEHRQELPRSEMRAAPATSDQLQAKLEAPAKTLERPQKSKSLHSGSTFAGSQPGREMSQLKPLASGDIAELPLRSRNSDLKAAAPPAPSTGEKDVNQPASPPASVPAFGVASETVEVTAEAAPGAANSVQPMAKLEQKKREGHVSSGSFAADGRLYSRMAVTRHVQWTISNGRLQHSLDGGKTWRAVEIENNPSLRTVSVMGDELWAAGDKGALYHSPDAGAHWVHVIPSTASQTLSDDIVRLEFVDADHGKLITSRNAIWATENCGATWEVQ